MADYTYRVTRTANGKYCTTCAEFPHLHFVAADKLTALAGIESLVQREAQRIRTHNIWQRVEDAGRDAFERDREA